MKLKKLFHALVLAGTALGVTHCGGGTATDPSGGTTTGGTTLPDGGVADGGTSGNPGMPGGPGGW